MSIFRVTKDARDAGEDWLICFGTDVDGGTWYIVTNHVHASEFPNFTDGARLDAELVCRLLNEHYEKRLTAHQADRLRRG